MLKDQEFTSYTEFKIKWTLRYVYNKSR